MNSQLFRFKDLVMIPAIGLLVILAGHFLLRQMRLAWGIDMDQYWPLSIAIPKPPVWQDVATLLAIIVTWRVFLKGWKLRWGMKYLFLVLVSLIVLTNLLQGLEEGFIYPVAGAGRHDSVYWLDASKISGTANLLEVFNWLQPELLIHSRTHPPGVLLFYYYLRSIWDQPLFVGGVMLGLSSVSGLVVYDLARRDANERIGRLVGALFLLLPAVQIYFWSAIDAVICMLFVVGFWAWRKSEGLLFTSKGQKIGDIWVRWLWLVIAFLAVWWASWLTFASLWLVGVLIVEEWRVSRLLWKSSGLLVVMGGLYWVVYQVSGFNYWLALTTARHLERAHGASDVVTLASYISTRLENVLEIAIFLGPYLLLLLYRAIKRRWGALRSFREVAVTPLLALGGLLALFGSGAYYTGETARAALYIYPFLLLLIADYFLSKPLSRSSEYLLLHLVFGQTVMMQLFVWFAW